MNSLPVIYLLSDIFVRISTKKFCFGRLYRDSVLSIIVVSVSEDSLNVTASKNNVRVNINKAQYDRRE